MLILYRATVATPINFVLLSFLAYLVYRMTRPSPASTAPQAPPAVVFKTFTPPTLKNYNGTNGYPIYFAVRGRVFDVTPGAQFYGPGGPYENFAGRDASRGLASHSFDEDMLTKDLNGPLDPLKDLEPSQVEALSDWEGSFLGKYLVVGRLVPVGDPEAPKS